jgi:hypothetical protein
MFSSGTPGFDTSGRIETALAAVGDLLHAEAAPVDVVVVVGATLNVLGIVSRTRETWT